MDLSHLKEFRQRAVLSQQQLSEKSGVARDTISKLENGQRQAYPATVHKLAAGLNVEPQVLARGTRGFEESQEPVDKSVEEGAEKRPGGPGRKKAGF